MSNSVITSILNNDNKAIESYYHSHRSHFISWAQLNYNISLADSQDLFQEIMIVLVTKIQNKTITTITTSLKTLIFGIGKQLIRNRLKLIYNKGVREEKYYRKEINELNINEPDDRYALIMSILDDMKEPCRSILKLFYIDNLSLKAIAVTLNYKSAESVKVQKHRCLKQLKENVFRKLRDK